MPDLSKLTIVSAREALQKGEFTARELTEAALNAIKARNGEVNAFLEVFDDALEQADKADLSLPLGGIPIAIKDNILFKGHKASASSKILENYVATYDSTAVRKLKEAGAVIVGRTNCDEFAMGASTENSAYGVTKNPHDTSRVAGGSSGGSAAAVAAGMVLAAIGSDTGGSIRQPAAFCGVVGLKPTYGRVSRHGLMAMASSLDQIGPFTKTVEDAELIYSLIRGQDSMDSTTIAEDTYGTPRAANKKIGIPRSFVEGEGISAEVKETFKQAEEKFKKMGYEVTDVNLPSLAYALAVYYIIQPAEVSSNMARYDGVKFGLHVDGKDSIDDYFKTRGAGLGKEVRRRIMLGTYVLSSGYYDAYYGQADNAKRAIRAELREAFKDVDLILTPTTPAPAFKMGERSTPLAMYLEDIFTVPANISGCPSISVPAGEANGLPVGILLTADLGNEEVLFKASKDYAA